MSLEPDTYKDLPGLLKKQNELLDQIRANDELEAKLKSVLLKSAKPNDFAKFTKFVKLLELITNLVELLIARLQWIDNNFNEKTRETKRLQVTEKIAETRDLKEFVQGKKIDVETMLQKYLNPQELEDYHRFITAKVDLIKDSRKTSDKICRIQAIHTD